MINQVYGKLAFAKSFFIIGTVTAGGYSLCAAAIVAAKEILGVRLYVPCKSSSIFGRWEGWDKHHRGADCRAWRWVVDPPAGGVFAVALSCGKCDAGHRFHGRQRGSPLCPSTGAAFRPWPVLAGHSISAIIGVTCARYIPQPSIAAACAVGLAIVVMHRLQCVHHPGGATAFAAVIGGSAIRQLGFWFVLFPVLTNAIVMVVLAVIINSVFQGRRYPATRHGGPSPAPSAPVRASLTQAEVVAAIKALDAPVEMSENEMRRLTELLAPKG